MGDKFTVEQHYSWLDGLVNIVPDILTGNASNEPTVTVTNQQTGETHVCPNMDAATKYMKDHS